jgi:hypothetical protein
MQVKTAAPPGATEKRKRKIKGFDKLQNNDM